MVEPDQKQENCPHSRLFGLIVRRERWGLSLRGWLLVMLLLAALGAFAAWGLDPFLAINRPVNAEFLVIEGWIAGYALEEGLKEFQAHPYSRLFTVGGRSDDATEPKATLAEAVASRLKKLGLPSNMVEAAPSEEVNRHRTYTSAVGLRKWFEEHHASVKAINVMTVGPHARRTRLLFEKALGDKVAVGIIAIPNRAYDRHHWWKSSEGTKETISEAAAYIYAKFFFWP